MKEKQYSDNSPDELIALHKELKEGVVTAVRRGSDFAWAERMFDKKAKLLGHLICAENDAEGIILDKGIWLPKMQKTSAVIMRPLQSRMMATHLAQLSFLRYPHTSKSIQAI